MSFQVHQNYFTEVEAFVNHLTNMHLQNSYTCLSLGLHFNSDNVALEGVSHFFIKRLGRSARTLSISLKCKTSNGGAPSSKMCKTSQDEWGKTQDAMEAAILLEKI